ncbi:MAG: chromosome segregation protein SMC [bacterium]
MYLKTLDILGFKSFANRTIIQFSPGITAIVGPNGCGKTNILDSLRWVLGEQKVTLLRGSKMEEVVFNGTRDMKPLGMAEVTLTVVNNRGVLPTDYNEVQVTRRLFRSGESEYLLNKVPCRRQDILELFFDTGMGAHSYSVIQQDMVDAVISDKAEERRFLFEEAAGITKYKQRKKAALRKLEATENDLLRLRDIFSEIQTQVRALNRQQKKAQRYQTVVENIRDWELCLSSSRARQLETEKRQQRADLDRLEDQRLQKQTALDRISGQLETDRKEQIDLEQELTAIGNEVYEISERAHSLEREISILVEKRSNGRQLTERNRDDIEALKSRREILVEQAQNTIAELKAQEVSHQELHEKLSRLRQEQRIADERLLAARTGKEQDNTQLIELESKLSSGRTEDDSLRRQEDELSQAVAALKEQSEQNLATGLDLRQQLDNQRRQLDSLSQQRSQVEDDRRSAQARLEGNAAQVEDLGDQLSELTASVEACQARKGLLEDMILHYEGYSAGVVSVMEDREQFPGLIGTVAEKFIPSPGFEVAVEAALGEMAGFLICEKRSAAEAIIDYLRRNEAGYVGALVPDTGTLNPVVKRPEIDLPEFLGWLDTHIDVEESLRPLMQAVLARTAAFEAGADPTNLLERLPFGFSAVSTDGRVYSKNIISGGSQAKLPLFKRQERLDEQDTQIGQLQQQIDQLRTLKGRLTAAIAADRAESSRLSELLSSLGEEHSSGREKISELEARYQAQQREQDRLTRDSKSQSERLEKIRNRQYSLGLDFDQLTSDKANLVDALSASDEQLQQMEQAATTIAGQVSRLQIEEVEARSRTEQTQSKLTHLQELQTEIETTVAAKDKEIVRAQEEIEAAALTMGELETELKEVFGRRQASTKRQGQLRTLQAEIQQRVDAHEGQLKQSRAEKEAVAEQRHQVEIHLNTTAAELRSLAERIMEEYEVDLTTVDTKRPDETMDDVQARQHLTQQKERLKQFGAVNLLALEEYKTAVEREAFLSEQIEDLSSAKQDLSDTITQINKRARQMFNDTFGQVKENFKKLFIELFTGGEADIFLEDPSNPLESDIHIIARPSGKKLLSITMMSGGERALTAIALLFSLYLVKPSPFCILDEIDAPLDDANCRRFLNIIKSFSGNTQFIIITHNKITMETASNLYGVTMSQPGISKMVAVRFANTPVESGAATLASPDQTPYAPAVENAGVPKTAAESPEETISVPDAIIHRMNSDVAVNESPDKEE